jgi:hypothetical protein
MIDRMQLTHTFEVGARIQLRLYYRKPAVAIPESVESIH